MLRSYANSQWLETRRIVAKLASGAIDQANKAAATCNKNWGSYNAGPSPMEGYMDETIEHFKEDCGCAEG